MTDTPNTDTHGARPLQIARMVFAGLAATILMSAPAAAQLPLTEARFLARQTHPGVAAARAATEAATALERQASARANPIFSYTHEQVGRNTQGIAALEQSLDIGGQRGARVSAARLRREAADARLAAAYALVDLEVAEIFAAGLAADRRAELAVSTAAQFRTASAAMNRRLDEGDVSAYETRRVHLESARYQALAAEASLVREGVRLRLRSLIGNTSDTVLTPLASVASLSLSEDSAVALALLHSPELQAATKEAQAAEADAVLAVRGRIPTPAVSGGIKRETFADAAGATGFAFGVSLPLPILDRRAGAISAMHAEARRLNAERDVIARRIAQETASALASVRQLDEQVAALRAVLGDESSAALRAAETAYAEGEITLVEWLDAVRAYQEAEYAFATVLSHAFTQRAVLERLLGIALIQ